MTTRDIRTTQQPVRCDVCGRTLLRGESTQAYLGDGGRHEVCELCAARATHEGWVREGAAPRVSSRPQGGERRRSMLGRWREARDAARAERGERLDAPPVTSTAPPPVREEPPPEPVEALDDVDDLEPREPVLPPAPRRRRARQIAWRDDADGAPAREPRHVRAVPTSSEQKTHAALESFNASEHTRTVAGIARSLGSPEVSARPCGDRPRVVTIVVAWELCWYRYEIDLSDDGTSVHAAGQGYELAELDQADRRGNAAADERGRLEPLAA